MNSSEYAELNINPNSRDHGYECGKCGYTPTQRELDNGSCPGCRIDRLANHHLSRKREACLNHGIRFVQATEPEVLGMWDWIDDVGGNACDQSFATEAEAVADAYEQILDD